MVLVKDGAPIVIALAPITPTRLEAQKILYFMGHITRSHAFSFLYYYILTRWTTDCQTWALYDPSIIEPHRLPSCQPVLPDSQCENDSPRQNPKQKMQGTIEVGEALEP